ncbi:hypothetical protein E6W39_29025 [Kitasatospora acidiphila]|uniref:Uncharacterized protein n=1 Tax=Kitasatospora acidiphila TaxID=2567942 RepID=A0A540W940_9ACTN|nr:hypothetical protein [Kitasatospora acidiphila]TQF05531.1 hypothetical protein E6W39_29025 [Kitasatospora acidiphila]
MKGKITVEIRAREDYGIMWLAGIRHVALDQHCLKSFGRPDRATVHPCTKLQTVHLPTANPPLAWYLCALPIPWNWAANAHLAFEAAPGYHWEGQALVPGLEVRLVGAKPITGWGEHSVPASEPHRSLRRYRTCRNWQFAWWLRQNRAAPTRPRPRSHPIRTTGR